MKTTPDNQGGSTHAPEPRSTSHAAAVIHRDDQLRKAWLYRRLLQSPVLQPFRKVLRPLLRWTFQPHFTVSDQAAGRVPLRLDPPSATTVLWWAIFGPFIALMLLPLLLIIVPLALLIGLGALISISAQTDADEQHVSVAQLEPQL